MSASLPDSRICNLLASVVADADLILSRNCTSERLRADRDILVAMLTAARSGEKVSMIRSMAALSRMRRFETSGEYPSDDAPTCPDPMILGSIRWSEEPRLQG